MSSPSVPVPLPPLPPPPLINKLKGEPLKISENLESSKIRDVFEQCKNILFDLVNGQQETKWILSNVDVEPKLQGSAPRCGLVALSMAAEMAQLTKKTKLAPTASPKTLKYDNSESELTALITLAKRLSFSSQGEIFSAKNIGVLAKEFYGLDTTITDCGFSNLDTIVKHLYQGHPVLVPYDASPNHEPYLANGHKSHWAVITGFFCMFDDSGYDWSKLQEHCHSVTNLQVKESCSTIFTLNTPGTCELQLPNNLNCSSLYFLARQPKSRHVAVWPWKLLQESNANLYEYSKDKEGANGYVFPEGGVGEGLCQKIIYLWQS